MSQREHLAFFAALIKSELGIVYNEANDYQLAPRLEDAARQLGYIDTNALYEAAKHGASPQVRALILTLATNHETQFFRDPAVFSAVTACADEWLGHRSQGRTFRAWSAACSFGQEVYSMSMALRRSSTAPRDQWFEIVATDVSERALAYASAGSYSELEVKRGLDAPELQRQFDPVAGRWTIKPAMRTGIRFQQQNLLDPFVSLGTFDLILCRNVLIYQDVANRQNIVSRMAERLSPGGHMILGAAESLLGISEAFDQVRIQGATVYRRRDQLSKAG